MSRPLAAGLLSISLLLVPPGLSAIPEIDTAGAAAAETAAGINALRIEHGLEPLRIDYAAAAAAGKHAAELVKRRTLSHRSADGRRVLERCGDEGCTALGAGENLGAGNSVSAVLRGWMGSGDHRRNMLNPRWSALGAGVAVLEGGRLVITAVFTGSRWSDTAVSFGDSTDDQPAARVTGIYHSHLQDGDSFELQLHIPGGYVTPSEIRRVGENRHRVTFIIPLAQNSEIRRDSVIVAELRVQTPLGRIPSDRIEIRQPPTDKPARNTPEADPERTTRRGPGPPHPSRSVRRELSSGRMLKDGIASGYPGRIFALDGL